MKRLSLSKPQPTRRRKSTNPNARADIALNPSFLPNGEPVPSADLPEIVRRLQDGDNRVIISISGKDSLAAWLFLREHDFQVIPYFCYTVPGLSYGVQWIEYLQKTFKTKIYRFLHPASAGIFSQFAYQPPQQKKTKYSGYGKARTAIGRSKNQKVRAGGGADGS